MNLAITCSKRGDKILFYLILHSERSATQQNKAWAYCSPQTALRLYNFRSMFQVKYLIHWNCSHKLWIELLVSGKVRELRKKILFEDGNFGSALKKSIEGLQWDSELLIFVTKLCSSSLRLFRWHSKKTNWLVDFRSILPLLSLRFVTSCFHR